MNLCYKKKVAFNAKVISIKLSNIMLSTNSKD